MARAGFDTDLPDDADDVEPAETSPIPSPRVGDDEQVVPGKKRRVPRSKGQHGPHRSPPAR